MLVEISDSTDCTPPQPYVPHFTPPPLPPPPRPVDLYESHNGDMAAIFEELELPAGEALKHKPSLDGDTNAPQLFGESCPPRGATNTTAHYRPRPSTNHPSTTREPPAATPRATPAHPF